MKQFLRILILALLLYPSFTFSKTQEIIAEGTYTMGDGETPTVAESRALLNAKRMAVEQAGTYIESYSKVKNFQLTHDEIQVLASGVMEVTILDKKRTLVGDGLNFWVKIKAKVSTDKIEEMVKKVKDKSVVEDYKQIKKEYEKLSKDMEVLKKQLKEAVTEKEKKQAELKIADSEKMFQANTWFEEGYKYIQNMKYDDAILAYTAGITLNPNYAEAYKYRGVAYSVKDSIRKIFTFDSSSQETIKDFDYIDSLIRWNDRAIEDFKKAVAINPNDDLTNIFILEAFIKRGHLYSMKCQYIKAIEAYSMAIGLNHDYADAYISRGRVYGSKCLYERAIEEFNKAIAINPKFAGSAFQSWGDMYFDCGQHDKAIIYWRKACDVGNDWACRTLKTFLGK